MFCDNAGDLMSLCVGIVAFAMSSLTVEDALFELTSNLMSFAFSRSRFAKGLMRLAMQYEPSKKAY